MFSDFWKCFVFVQVFCICEIVLYLCKCFVFVQMFCDLYKCFVIYGSVL